MKISVRILAGIILLLSSSCSNDMEEGFPSTRELTIPVKLTVTQINPHTRAVVNNIVAISVGTLGIYEVAEGSSAGNFPRTTSPLLTNAAPSGINGNLLTFSPKLYYPMGGRKIIFYGYYPRTTATSGTNYVTSPGNGIAPTFNFTLTGQEDIMYAISNPSGSTVPGATVALTFNYKLTQMQLTISSLLSAILSSVKILSVKNTGSMNLETGVITYNSGSTDISFTS